MKKYISLLRGINVSGKNLIKMEVLKQLCQALNFTQVETYIQSGNLIFQSDETNPILLSQQIQEAIAENLGLIIFILTFPLETFKGILEQNPFTEEHEREQLYITFLSTTATADQIELIQAKKAKEEQLYYIHSTLYLIANLGYGKTKLTNTFIENKLNGSATTRNYRTCLKLIAIAEQL